MTEQDLREQFEKETGMIHGIDLNYFNEFNKWLISRLLQVEQAKQKIRERLDSVKMVSVNHSYAIEGKEEIMRQIKLNLKWVLELLEGKE